MKTIKVRDLRGAALEEHCRNGDLVGVTRDRALIAVIVPMMQAWVEHLVEHNWSRIYENTRAAEASLGAASSSITGLDGALWRCSIGEAECTGCKVCRSSDATSPSARRNVMEMLRRLFAPVDDADEVHFAATETVRVGALSARKIEQASAEQKLLVLTNDGMLIGLLVPVSQNVVRFLVAQNLSRIIYNIQRGEREVAEEARFASLADTVETMKSDSDDDLFFEIPSDVDA